MKTPRGKKKQPVALPSRSRRERDKAEAKSTVKEILRKKVRTQSVLREISKALAESDPDQTTVVVIGRIKEESWKEIKKAMGKHQGALDLVRARYAKVLSKIDPDLEANGWESFNLEVESYSKVRTDSEYFCMSNVVEAKISVRGLGSESKSSASEGTESGETETSTSGY